jgi:hypothetical protein
MRKRENDLDQPSKPCRSLGVPDIGLHAAHEQRIAAGAVFSHDGAKGLQLYGISKLSPGAVGLPPLSIDLAFIGGLRSLPANSVVAEEDRPDECCDSFVEEHYH